MKEALPYIILQAVFFLSSLLAAPRYIHMLQLESYQAPGYVRWLKKNADMAALPLLPAILAALLAMWRRESFVIWIVVGLYCLPPLLFFRKKAKKPLRFTARVLRLMAVLVMVQAGLSCLVWLPAEMGIYRSLILSLAFVALPFSVMLANLMTLPVQKIINNGYIRDAQRILTSHPGLTIIGVTGSYGKTSVKQILGKLLSTKFSVFITPESYNTPMGIVRAIREGLNATHEIFVCEMGARHVGDIRENCDIVHPKHGVITSIGPMHLETFKSIENITATKLELADALPDDGIAFLCGDSEYIRGRSVKGRAVYFGLDDGNGYRADDISADLHGTRFTVYTPDGRSHSYAMPLLGRHQVSNVLAAVAVADTLGIELPRLAPAIRSLQPVPHRLQLIPGGRFTIIDDAFNANPAGTKAALEVLGMLDGVRVLVTPGMVELGERQDELNRDFGIDAAAVCDYVALVGEKQTAPLAEGLEQAGFPAEKYRAFDTLEAAMDWVRGIEDERNFYVLLENDLPDNY